MKNSDAYYFKTRGIYNICSLDNIATIVQFGLLSYNRAKNIKHTSIANEEIQENRDNIVITKEGDKLHDYACCYFNPRNAMLFKMICDGKTCIIISISLEVLDLEGTVVTDRNAASQIMRFYQPENGINAIEFDKVYSKGWRDIDTGIVDNNLKQIMQAEVLVKDRIPPEYFLKIIVPNQKTKNDVLNVLSGYNINVEVNRSLFFDKQG